MGREESLVGGNASGTVVRVGQTVRKPWASTTPLVITYMEALRRQDIDVPKTYTRDEQGRFCLEFIPGTMAIEQTPLPDDVVQRVGALIRTIHDASEPLGVPSDWPNGVLPAPHRELICHNDLATWNLVINGDRLVFIDWDGAAPSSRAWDLAYAAISFAHLSFDANPSDSARRLRAFLRGYRPDEKLCEALPGMLIDRSRAMFGLLQTSHEDHREPWATMYEEGHGLHWQRTTQFIEDHASLWAEVGDCCRDR